jgi:outer membrane lipopolysaccharide assembly protein LptE/RlpB
MLLKRLIILIFILLPPLLLSACGYSLLKQTNGTAGAVETGGASISSNNNTDIYSPAYGNYSSIKNIYIKPFKNITYKSGIGIYFSDNIAYYLNSSTGMFSSNKNNAQYYLTGRIISINNSVISYTGVAAAVQYSISATVSINLYKTSGKILFHNVTLTSSANYFNYENPLVGHKQEKTALDIVSKRIAKKIILLIETKAIIHK